MFTSLVVVTGNLIGTGKWVTITVSLEFFATLRLVSYKEVHVYGFPDCEKDAIDLLAGVVAKKIKKRGKVRAEVALKADKEVAINVLEIKPRHLRVHDCNIYCHPDYMTVTASLVYDLAILYLDNNVYKLKYMKNMSIPYRQRVNIIPSFHVQPVITYELHVSRGRSF